jgi:hypothetical protein
MAIKHSIRIEDGILSVQASGKDDNLGQVKAYGTAVMEAAIAADCDRILCDERDLVYSLGTLDTIESAKYISEIVPRIAKVAIVCNPKQVEDGEFWETVAVNRGLEVRVFIDPGDARVWLKQHLNP